MRDSLKLPGIILLSLVALGLILLLAIEHPYNYSGNGNEFVLTAVLKHTGDSSVTVQVTNLNEAAGKSRTWFAPGSHQIHNNYFNSNDSKKTVGKVFINGSPSSIQDLHPGDTLVIHGSIRDSKDGKSSSYRPVYTEIDVTR